MPRSRRFAAICLALTLAGPLALLALLSVIPPAHAETIYPTVGTVSTTHNLLSSTHSDTTTASPTRGDIITAQTASPTWKRLALGAQWFVPMSDGTDVGYANPFVMNRTVTAGGTTGAQTINKQAGTVNVAAGQGSIAITNSLVNTSSIVFTVLRTADGTCTFVKSVVPTASTITVTLNANCTAETSVGFLVTN